MNTLYTSISTGKYVLAVSGGVDSVVLLDILSKNKDLDLIVAHFDHGIRPDSIDDQLFVKNLAKKYGLKYEFDKGNLGKNASEAEAREARYNFLNTVKEKYATQAIITAHHQDDVIETSMINLIRGTGRQGLTSLKSNSEIIRPLLFVSKADLLKYAKDHNLVWNEDSTNTDKKYLRNKLRLDVVNKMTTQQRSEWLQLLEKEDHINTKLDKELNQAVRRGLHKNQLVLNRHWFAMLPHAVAKEILISILKQAGAKDIDRKTVERLTIQLKTIPAGKTLQTSGIEILLTKRSARFYSKNNSQKC